MQTTHPSTRTRAALDEATAAIGAAMAAVHAQQEAATTRHDWAARDRHARAAESLRLAACHLERATAEESAARG